MLAHGEEHSASEYARWIAVFCVLTTSLVLGGCWLFAPAPGPPSLPAELSASAGTYDDRVSVTWSEVEDVSRYLLERAMSSDGPFSTLTETAATFYEDYDVSLNTRYWYRLKSCVGQVCSTWSEATSGFAMPGEHAPSAPMTVSASRGDHANKVVVSWGEVFDAVSYQVYRADDQFGAYEFRGQSVTTRYEDGAVVPGESYWYRVRSCGADACGGLSTEAAWGFAQVAPSPEMPPSPPRVVNASAGEHREKIRISWTSSIGATLYEIYRLDAPPGDPGDDPSPNDPPQLGDYRLIGETAGVTFDDMHHGTGNPLDPCRDYWYRVRARNEAGASEFSYATSGHRGTLMVDSAPPPNLRVSYRTHDEKIEARWDAIDGAKEYLLEYSTDGEGWSEAYRGAEKSYAHKYVHSEDIPQAEQDYLYRVSGCGDGDCGCTAPSTVPEIGRRRGLPVAPDFTKIEKENLGLTVLDGLQLADNDPMRRHLITLTWKWTWEPGKSPNPVEVFVIYRRVPGQTGHARHAVLLAEDVVVGSPPYVVGDLAYVPATTKVTYGFEWVEEVAVAGATTYEYYIKAETMDPGHGGRSSGRRTVSVSGP